MAQRKIVGYILRVCETRNKVAYVKDKKLKGIQLHAGVENDLTRAYKVEGIPRYILIDKSGNLISADSPRPSDPKLKALLEEWSKK